MYKSLGVSLTVILLAASCTDWGKKKENDRSVRNPHSRTQQSTSNRKEGREASQVANARRSNKSSSSSSSSSSSKKPRVINTIRSVLNRIGKSLSVLYKDAKEVFSGAEQLFDDIGSSVNTHIETAKGHFESLRELLEGYAESAGEVSKDVRAVIASIHSELIEAMEDAQDLGESAIHKIEEFLGLENSKSDFLTTAKRNAKAAEFFTKRLRRVTFFDERSMVSYKDDVDGLGKVLKDVTTKEYFKGASADEAISALEYAANIDDEQDLIALYTRSINKILQNHGLTFGIPAKKSIDKNLKVIAFDENWEDNLYRAFKSFYNINKTNRDKSILSEAAKLINDAFFIIIGHASQEDNYSKYAEIVDRVMGSEKNIPIELYYMIASVLNVDTVDIKSVKKFKEEVKKDVQSASISLVHAYRHGKGLLSHYTSEDYYSELEDGEKLDREAYDKLKYVKQLALRVSYYTSALEEEDRNSKSYKELVERAEEIKGREKYDGDLDAVKADLTSLLDAVQNYYKENKPSLYENTRTVKN